MKSFSIGALIAAAAALGISIFCTFTLDNALSWTDRVNLIFDPASAESFDAYYFAFGTLPRFAAAAIGGALLGLVGSLLQQLTQNPMTSPLTLGTSSGGWLAVVLISAFFPGGGRRMAFIGGFCWGARCLRTNPAYCRSARHDGGRADYRRHGCEPSFWGHCDGGCAAACSVC